MSELLTLSYHDSQAVLCERHPTEYPIGIESYYDGPVPLGGGQGGFSWFRSHDEAARYFVDVALRKQWLPLVGLENDAEFLAWVESALHEPFHGDAGRKHKLEVLNAELAGLLQVRFWGSRDELLAGDSEFAKQIRVWFRRGADDFDDEPISDAPITPEERDAFIEQLPSYGW
jgi:hypothetical protein